MNLTDQDRVQLEHLNLRLEELIELIQQQPEIKVPEVDVTPIADALDRFPPPPTADAIAAAIVSRLHFPEPTDITPALSKVAELLEKQQGRLSEGPRMSFGNQVKVKSATDNPVYVELTNPEDISSGGGGSEVLTGTTAGPVSYSTGGFTVDLSASLASVGFFAVAVTAVGVNLPPCHYEYAYNSPSNGKVKVKVMRHRYDKSTATSGTPGGLPSGVTSRATSGGSAAAVDAVGGSGTALHVNELYSHTHSISTAAADAASAELAAGTDLSATTWAWVAVGA